MLYASSDSTAALRRAYHSRATAIGTYANCFVIHNANTFAVAGTVVMTW